MPVLHQFVRRIGVVAHGLGQGAPGRTALADAAEGRAFAQAAVVPVGEPHFLGGQIHMLFVEDAGVGDEAVVHILMDTGQVIHAVAAVGSAASRHAADIRFGLDGPCGRKVILHIEADVVSGDFLAPFLAEGRGAAAVRKHHHIALVGHQHIIPAIAPALGKRALGTAQADLDGGIRLGRIKLRREENPGEHLLAVHGGEPAGLGLVLVQLTQQVLVLVS